MHDRWADQGADILRAILDPFPPVKAAAKLVTGIKGMKTVAVLGIGGSSLGGQALTALRKLSSGG